MLRKIVLFFTVLSVGFMFSVTGANAGHLPKSVLTIGADTTFPPFEYEVNGKVRGFDIDLIRAIAKVEGLKTKIRTFDFQGLIPALQVGTIDVAVAGITIRPGRAKVVNFSYPYYHSGLSILVKRGSPVRGLADLMGKRVAVKLGTTADIMMSHKNGVKVERFNNIDDAYNQMQNGGADAVVFDNPVNLNYAKSHKGVHTVGKLLTGEDYGIAMTKKEPWILKVINSGLVTVYANGTYSRLYKKYFGNDKNGFVKIVH